MKIVALIGVCLLSSGPLHAQRTDSAAAPVVQPSNAWRPLRVAKWSGAAITTAAAIYGVRTNLHADALYDELERSCVAEPDVCTLRDADGQYLDNGLEAQYRQVTREDRRARNALLTSQVGIAATVVMFVLDLRNARAPADIPYQPPALQVAPTRAGGLGLSYRVRVR